MEGRNDPYTTNPKRPLTPNPIRIDAYENRDVGTADVAGAYLKAYMDD
jgi:hypothetical protein